jgi:hypothetical protein
MAGCLIKFAWAGRVRGKPPVASGGLGGGALGTGVAQRWLRPPKPKWGPKWVIFIHNQGIQWFAENNSRPSNGFLRCSSGYLVRGNRYLVPSNRCSRRRNRDLLLSNGYSLPSNGYLLPSSGCLLPSNGYLARGSRYLGRHRHRSGRGSHYFQPRSGPERTVFRWFSSSLGPGSALSGARGRSPAWSRQAGPCSPFSLRSGDGPFPITRRWTPCQSNCQPCRKRNRPGPALRRGKFSP